MESNCNDELLNRLPLRCVPPKERELLKDSYRCLVRVEICNEKENISGNFGWCVVCRAAAQFYCKLLRAPVCSSLCKGQYQDSLLQLEAAVAQETASRGLDEDSVF